MICSIPQCGKKTLARGWCSAHYTRWRTHGDPLRVSQAANGEPLRWLREQSAQETDDCIIWPFRSRWGKGYPAIWDGQTTTGAHRLMCRMCHGEPFHGGECAHSCGQRLCVNPRHLRWATPAENAADKRAHGTVGAGERNAAARLREPQVRAIREMAELGLRRLDIAAAFGVSRRNVGMIIRRDTWREIA